MSPTTNHDRWREVAPVAVLCAFAVNLNGWGFRVDHVTGGVDAWPPRAVPS